MEELRQEFLSETSFFIEQIEESFLSLNDPIKRDDLLAHVFRLMHSIKGAGAAVGFSELSDYAHVLEDLLTVLRVNSSVIDENIQTLLLKGIDLLKGRILELQTGNAKVWHVEEFKLQVKQKVEALRLGPGIQPQMPAAKPSLPMVPVSLEATLSDVPAKATETGSSSRRNFVKVDLERVDFILDAVGELVVIRSQLLNEVNGFVQVNPRLRSIVELYDRSIRDLQEKAMGLRLTPLKSTFLKLQRVARDLSVKLNKPVDFHIQGEDVELDRQVVEALADPLLHLIRNGIDHGIEAPEKRKLSKKNAVGQMHIRAQAGGGRLTIQIRDDGGGIDLEKVFQKALSKGLLPAGTEFSTMSEQSLYDLLFAPGFSTAEVISEVSGRGVGLDVVKTNIAKLKGLVQIKSEVGKGTQFIVQLPMQASVTDGILVKVGGHSVILPLDSVYGILDATKTKMIDTKQKGIFLPWENQMIPVYELRQLLVNIKFNSAEEVVNKILIVLDCMGQQMAVLVEEILGQSQVVSKTVRSTEGEMKDLAGAAILGDGKVALVLDTHELWQSSLAFRTQEVAA
jgi:two-component system chemotaxis sensor kinase CheA